MEAAQVGEQKVYVYLESDWQPVKVHELLSTVDQ